MNPGILEQVNNAKAQNYSKLTLEMLDEFISYLEAESDHKITREQTDEIWRKIRLGIPLTEQEDSIHKYSLEIFKKTGKYLNE